MSTPRFELNKSTIVRIILIGGATWLSSACSTLPEPLAQAQACPPARTLVCDTFGSQSRCMCSDTSRVDRQLDRAGLPALGLNAW